MKSVLEASGWITRTPAVDLAPEALTREISIFLEQIRKSPGAEAFVYMSGHGITVGGEPRLRIAALNATEFRLGTEPTLSVNALLSSLEAVGASLSIVVFDACRDASEDSKFPALKMPSPQRARLRNVYSMEQVVLYATAQGSTAQDGVNAEGQFTTVLAGALGLPNVTVQDAFEQARTRVWANSHGQQRPEMVTSASPVPFSVPGREIMRRAAAKVEPSGDGVFGEKWLAVARDQLGPDGVKRRSEFSEEDSLANQQLDYAIQSLFPPVQAAKEQLEKLTARGNPWAALTLAFALDDGLFGANDSARGRALAGQLQQAGMDIRLRELQKKGSQPATLALALLSLENARADDDPKAIRALVQAASRA
ncbi:hypothetical protein Q9L58_010872, partial [Maublancomyces gigas]